MTSFSYKILSLGVRLSGLKRFFSLPMARLLEKAAARNSKRPFVVPPDGSLFYSDEQLLDCHCLVIKKQKAFAKKALLYLYGGGMILAPGPDDLSLGQRFCEDTARDIWFPHYPLCPRYNALESLEYVIALYRRMLEHYQPQDIAFAGFSAGAGLALELLCYNNLNNLALPMPSLVIASSPGNLPINDEEQGWLEQRNHLDIALDANFFRQAADLMGQGADIPKELLSFAHGDYRGAPPTHFYYGSYEVLEAFRPIFAASYEKAGASCIMHVAQGIGHNYPIFTSFPEARAAYKEMVSLLTE